MAATVTSLRKTMLKIQLSLTLGECHASVGTFARYKVCPAAQPKR